MYEIRNGINAGQFHFCLELCRLLAAAANDCAPGKSAVGIEASSKIIE